MGVTSRYKRWGMGGCGAVYLMGVKYREKKGGGVVVYRLLWEQGGNVMELTFFLPALQQHGCVWHVCIIL